jgi:hypothetical protein
VSNHNPISLSFSLSFSLSLSNMDSVRGKSEKREKKQRREKLERGGDGYVDSDNSEREDKRISRLKV